MKNDTLFDLTNLEPFILIVFNGMASLFFGIWFVAFAVNGDPPGPTPIKIDEGMMFFGKSIIFASLFYLVTGLVLLFLWRKERAWVTYSLVILAILHIIGSVFLLLNERWIIIVCLLTFLVPIVANILLIRILLKVTFQKAVRMLHNH